MDTIGLFLLTVIVSTFVATTQSQECKHPLPLLMKAASGIDITKFDFLPIGAPNSNWDGYVDNIFNYTCDGGTKWLDRHFDPPIEYDVPERFDYLLHAEDYLGIHYSIDHTVFEAKISKANLIDPFNFNIDMFKILPQFARLFTQNPKYQSLAKQYYDSGKISAWIFDGPGALTFNPRETGPFTKDFREFIHEKLPLKYEDNPTIYQQFVQRFGSHYLLYGEYAFGRYLQFAINQRYVFEHLDEEILRNLKNAFCRTFNNCRFGNETVDEEFAKNSEVILSFGGKTSKWVDKVSGKTFFVDSDRVLLYAHFGDIGWLIGNDEIRAQVEIATKMYSIQAYLGELKTVYNYTNYRLSEEENASLVQVETVLKANDIQNMDKIDKIIHNLYDKVLVFADRKSCYPTLYDQYVTANLKSEFTKNVCAFSKNDSQKCASKYILHGQRDINELMSLYENEKLGQNCVENVRYLNLVYRMLNDRDNGLKAICGECEED